MNSLFASFKDFISPASAAKALRFS